MEQKKWQSWALWTAIVAQVLSILSFVGFFGWVGVTQEYVGQIVGGVLQLLVILGVLNNPNSKTTF